MAENKSAVAQFSAMMKDLVAILRDTVIFLIFMLLLFAPGIINERLTAAGFTKGNIAGFEWQAQIKSAAETTKTAGQTIEQATENYDQLIERINELEKQVNDPGVQRELNAINSVAKDSRSELASADQAIKRSLVVQQQLTTQFAPQLLEETGWIYVGKISEDKSSWLPGSPTTITKTELPIEAGQVVTVRDDVYLRADGASNARASAPVQSVVKVGQRVEVLEVEFSHARSGGWFVWLKVVRRD